ncbi:transposase [Streptomyces sp. NPDC048603]|uniref:transposase n=1 Tax=Streptomyces sp. NPDC048603 TaxID=3365577 RepID=UPI003724105C
MAGAVAGDSCRGGSRPRGPGWRPDGPGLGGVRQPQRGVAAARGITRTKVPAPRVVGVDEYATRKGRVYGTVLVDVESRRPVDLLPDREASSLAAWLAKRPGSDRDRDAVIAGRTLP